MPVAGAGSAAAGLAQVGFGQSFRRIGRQSAGEVGLLVAAVPTVDRIVDHLLVARAMAEQAGESRLIAIVDQALKRVFEPYGFDPSLRQ